MDKITTYINEASSVIEYIKAKNSRSWQQDIKEKYRLSDVATYFSSDIIHNEEEFIFVKKALELDAKAVYTYNEKTEYTDRLADFGTTLFIDEQNYRVFLMISDFHLWFYDVEHFRQLLQTNKLIFANSPAEIMKTTSSISVRQLCDEAFNSMTEEMKIQAYMCQIKVNSYFELFNFYFNGCLSENEVDTLVNYDNKPLDLDYILFIVKLAFQKPCFVLKLSELLKKLTYVLNRSHVKPKSEFAFIMENL